MDQTLYSEKDYQADEFELYVLRQAGDLAHLDQERLRQSETFIAIKKRRFGQS